MDKKERIDKLIASQGLATRSEVKSLIRKGEVILNGTVVKDSAVKVSYDDDIVVSGQKLFQSEHIYIMLNKPQGVVSASNDKREKTVVDIVPDEFKRKNLFPAGRLDKDTVGFCLIFITQLDGSASICSLYRQIGQVANPFYEWHGLQFCICIHGETLYMHNVFCMIAKRCIYHLLCLHP